MVVSNITIFGHSLRSLIYSGSLSNHVFKRYSSKRARLSKYFEPYVKRKHMLGACEPYFARETYLPEERCYMNQFQSKDRAQYELIPLEKIYAEELKQKLLDNDLVLLLHRNYIHHQQMRLFRNELTKADGSIEILNNDIYKCAFEDLKRTEVLRFFVSHNAVLIGKSERLSDYLRALRKVPQLLLLAGHLEGKYLVNRGQLVKMAVTTNLDLTRAHLCNTLDMHGVELSRILSSVAEGSSDRPDGESSS